MSDTSHILEAAILADTLADNAAKQSLLHEADILTATSRMSAFAAAGAWQAADAEARKWQAVAAKLRAMAAQATETP